MTNGYVYSIRERKFKEFDPTTYGELQSPRDFKSYDVDCAPTGKYLEESLQNSFPDLRYVNLKRGKIKLSAPFYESSHFL